MIKLKMISPMPDMLKLMDGIYTLKKEIPFRPGMTTGDIMEGFAEENLEFQKLWQEKTCAALEKCLFAINGAAVNQEGSKWDIPLEDGMEVRIFMPYAGG